MTGAVDDHWAERPSRGGFEASRLERVGEQAAAVGVGLLIVTGFASSYTTLRDLAVEVGGFSPWLAPAVPLSFDLGIVVLSLKVILAARAGREAPVLRVLVLLLSAATVAANGAASASTVGRLLHAVPPAMFVVCFETLAASARHDAHTRRAAGGRGVPEEALPVLTVARWLLAPRQTWSIWRARVLGAVPRASIAPAPAPGLAAALAPGRSLLGDLIAGTAVTASSAHGPHGWPAGDRPSSPVLDTRPHQLPTAVRHGATVPADIGQHDRLAVAVDALRADPAMTAVALADHLGGAGHPVSVRTAQRVRHQAEQHLDVRSKVTEVLLPAGDRTGVSG